MNRQHLLDIVGCIERANSTVEGTAALPDYFGRLYYRLTIHDDEALAGIMAEVECMGKPLFFDTYLQQVSDIHGSGGYVYMSHELATSLCEFFMSYPVC